MSFMDFPVYYLQRSDFDDAGDITHPFLKDKKVLVMLQANFCGYCTSAKPDFQRLAQVTEKREPRIICATVQADGNATEKQVMELIDRIKPDFKGFPDYVVYINGKRRHDNGPKGRDMNSLSNYIMGQ